MLAGCGSLCIVVNNASWLWFICADIDPSLCKHIELGATTCQGYLYKQGGIYIGIANKMMTMQVVELTFVIM